MGRIGRIALLDSVCDVGVCRVSVLPGRCGHCERQRGRAGLCRGLVSSTQAPKIRGAQFQARNFLGRASP